MIMQTQKSTIPDTASLPNAPARGECPSQVEVSVGVGCSDFFWSNAFIEPKRGKALPQMQLRRQVCRPPARAVAERFLNFPRGHCAEYASRTTGVAAFSRHPREQAAPRRVGALDASMLRLSIRGNLHVCWGKRTPQCNTANTPKRSQH